MNFIQLTQENARKYVGYDIVFSFKNRKVCRQILRVSRSGKTIYIDYPDVDNKLQYVDYFHINVILDEEAQLMKQLDEIRRRKEENRIEVINKLREQHRNKILEKIRTLAYELETFDKLTHDEFIITEL
jgi:uncharacterized NAD(P)/FAD-binding protein YdhS